MFSGRYRASNRAQADAAAASKTEISWDHEIRSYLLRSPASW